MSTKVSSTPISVSHRIHTLLHTVRNIAHFEDELCTLLHESERTGTLSDEASADLVDLLARMPAEEYVADMEALSRTLLALPAPAKQATRPRIRKPAPIVKGRRKS